MIVVFSDPTSEAGPAPPADALRTLGLVSYEQVPAEDALPAASHYVFRCGQTSEGTRRLMALAAACGSSVTLIARQLDAVSADEADRLGISVLPPYGPTGHITVGTLKRLLAQVMLGRRIVAHGFVRNSIGRYASSPPGQSLLVNTLTEMSERANGGTPILAAVLALQRTGSKFLHDLIGLTVSGRVRTYHEHHIPASGGIGRRLLNAALTVQRIGPAFLHNWVIGPVVGRQRSAVQTPDQVASSREATRNAAFRRTVLEARRRIIFVSERDPVDRIVSYFSWQRRNSLRPFYDARRRTLRNVKALQREFDEFLKEHTARQRIFYRRQLLETFGLNVLRTKPVQGLFVGHNRENTLVIVPIDRLSELRRELASIYGAEAYDAMHDNSAGARAYAAIDRLLRDQIQVSTRAVDALWSIPEIAHVHSRVGR